MLTSGLPAGSEQPPSAPPSSAAATPRSLATPSATAAAAAVVPLERVWRVEELALLARLAGEVLQGTTAAQRVGRATSGSCAVAALWWLVKQPGARLKARAPPPVAVGGATGVAEVAAAAADGEGAGSGGSVTEGGAGAAGALAAGGGRGAVKEALKMSQAVFRLQLRKKDRAGA